MKKILVIILCFIIVSCSAVTAFASETNSGDGTEIDNGRVLYYQAFGESFKGKTFADAGMTEKTNTNGTTTVENGFLSSTVSTNKKSPVVTLPDVLSSTTYTVEMSFRFKKNGSNVERDSSAIFIGFNFDDFNNDSFDYRAGMYYRDNSNNNNYKPENTKFNKTDVEALNAVRSAWQLNGNTYGEDAKITVAVKNDILYKMTISCDNKVWECTDVYDTYKNEELNSGILYIWNYQSGIDISSIRVVEGVDYTDADLHGQFATKSYSDFCNTDVISTGVQPGLTDAKARLVAEIDGSKFAAAGFKVSLSYTDNTDSSSPVAVTTQTKDMTAHYAYTSLAADGVIGAITPENSGNYLIAIVIDGIPDTVSDLKVTFTPYAVTADGETYIGLQFVYDFATQTVTVQ